MVTVCEWFAPKITRTLFAGLASKPVVTVSGCFASKPVATVCDGLASKPAATVFSSLTSKLVATISPGLASNLMIGFLVEPQNQSDREFPNLALRFISCATKPTERGRRGTRVEI
jgi:hypothetical protein